MAQSKTNDRCVDFSAALQGYPRDPKYLLPVLYKLQENYGFLSTEMLQEAARHLGVPVGKVYSLATFGEEFRLEPLGRCVIEVCSGACCRIKGSGGILSVLEAELGIKAGQTTQNGAFTLLEASCIDACALAPAMRVNGHLYGNLQGGDVLRIIKEYELLQKSSAK